MQHNRAGRKLRRTTSHRLAMFSNQLDSLMNLVGELGTLGANHLFMSGRRLAENDRAVRSDDWI